MGVIAVAIRAAAANSVSAETVTALATGALALLSLCGPVDRPPPPSPTRGRRVGPREMNPPHETESRRLHLAFAASLAGLASAFFGYVLLAERVQPLPFDAEHFYFPMASRLLEEGFAYLLSPESVRSTPVSYLWPALFGNDPASLRIAHVAAGMALCLLAFDTVRRLCSPWAGAIAAWALALSPLLRPFIAQPLTEAPFLLFTAIWWWGLVAYLQGERLFLIPAVIGGSLSMLTRQVWFYPVVLLVLSAAALRPLRNRGMTSRMLLAHALILVAPAMFMVKNYVIVDHAVVATGAGSALYFGQHPLTGGFEPPLIGLSYDEGAVLSLLSVDHKSPLGDRVLTTIGLQWLRDRPIFDSLAEMPMRIGRVLFLPNRGLAPTVFNDRALRIATVCLALIGLVAMRRNPLVVLLGAGLALQSLQLSIVLFNNRYSVGTLDYGLIVLASIGLAWSAKPVFTTYADAADARPTPRGWQIARGVAVSSAVVLLCTAGISLGYWVQRFMPPEDAKMPRDPGLVRALGPAPQLLTWTAEGTALALDAETVSANPDVLIRLAIPALHPDSNANVMWMIRMSVASPRPGRCRRATIAFTDRSSETTGPTRELWLKDDGSVHDYVVGAHPATSVLFPRGEGELRLQFACAVGTRIGLKHAALYDSRIPEVYAPRAEEIARRFR